MQSNTHVLPTTAVIEDIPVLGFSDPFSLFERLKLEAAKPQQSVVAYVNVHVANTAKRLPRLRSFLQTSDVVYVDGAGIVAGAKLLGQHLPTRLAAADWILDLVRDMADSGHTVFFLGGEPGVAEKAFDVIEENVPNHTVVGYHHGYLHNNPQVEQQAINAINAARPDILIVGFGTPLQEYWIEENRHRLDVSVIYPLGAVMDFLSGKVSRCPAWMGKYGFEWLYRLYVEPRRMFGRYVIGNTWFMGRMLVQAAELKFQGLCSRLFASLQRQMVP